MPHVDRADGVVAAHHRTAQSRSRASTSPVRRHAPHQPVTASTAKLPPLRGPSSWLPRLRALDEAYGQPPAPPQEERTHSQPPQSRDSRAVTLPPIRQVRQQQHPTSTAGGRRERAELLERSAHVLALRLAALVNQEERYERQDLERDEKLEYVSITKQVTAARMRVNYACDAGAAGKQAPDSALIHSPTLARGSPARSRKLAGGVGLGIGGIVNVNQAPPGRKLIAHGEDAKAKQRCDRAVKDTKVKNIYRAHDLRTLHSRTVIDRAHYHHPHPIDARVELLPSHALTYEARLVLVKELHSREELEADCAEKFRWILTNEESQRVSALQRSRVAKHQAQLLQRERQFAASAVMNDIIHGVLLAQEGAEDDEATAEQLKIASAVAGQAIDGALVPVQQRTKLWRM
jgi:hypothetical protein